MNDSTSFEAVLPRELTAVRGAAAAARKFLASRNVSESAATACELALVEACNNAVLHGLAQGDLQLEVRITDGIIEIRVCDQGPGFELPVRPKLPPDHLEHGRGLFLIRSLVDDLRLVHPAANRHCLVMRKRLRPEGQSEMPV